MQNEPYYGQVGHTLQLMRLKSEEYEFSLFRVRQRAKGRRSCSSRIWLLKRFFASGSCVRVRVAAATQAELEAIATLPERLIRCEEIWTAGKHRSTTHEPAERPAL